MDESFKFNISQTDSLSFRARPETYRAIQTNDIKFACILQVTLHRWPRLLDPESKV